MVRHQQDVGFQVTCIAGEQRRLVARLDVRGQQHAPPAGVDLQHTGQVVALALASVVAGGRVQHAETHRIPGPCLAGAAAFAARLGE